MNKKKTTIVKLMASFVLALIMCLGTATPAFAALDYSKANGTEDAKAAIAKILTIPAGMATPDKTFKFVYTPKTVNEEGPALSFMPSIPDTLIKIDSTSTPDIVKTPGKRIYTVQSENIFAGVDWKHAGEFIYEVREDPETGTNYIFSQAMYEFHIFVENRTTSGLQVMAITAYKRANDDGSTDGLGGEKTNPTPGGGTDGVSDVKFNNSYSSNIGGTDPTDPDDHVLKIGKTVGGRYGDRIKYFPFELKLNAPAGSSPAYKAYVVEADGANKYKVVTDDKNYSGAIGSDTFGSYINVSATGTVCEFKLKHEQWLIFIELPLGTECTVTENGTPRYEPSVQKYIADVNGDEITVPIPGAVNVPLVVGPFFINEAISPSTVGYLNTFTSDISPTGIGVDNLPFIMLIVFALVALAGYVVFRTRRTAAKAGK